MFLISEARQWLSTAPVLRQLLPLLDGSRDARCGYRGSRTAEPRLGGACAGRTSPRRSGGCIPAGRPGSPGLRGLDLCRRPAGDRRRRPAGRPPPCGRACVAWRGASAERSSAADFAPAPRADRLSWPKRRGPHDRSRGGCGRLDAGEARRRPRLFRADARTWLAGIARRPPRGPPGRASRRAVARGRTPEDPWLATPRTPAAGGKALAAALVARLAERGVTGAAAPPASRSGIRFPASCGTTPLRAAAAADSLRRPRSIRRCRSQRRSGGYRLQSAEAVTGAAWPPGQRSGGADRCHRAAAGRHGTPRVGRHLSHQPAGPRPASGRLSRHLPRQGTGCGASPRQRARGGGRAALRAVARRGYATVATSPSSDLPRSRPTRSGTSAPRKSDRARTGTRRPPTRGVMFRNRRRRNCRSPG